MRYTNLGRSGLKVSRISIGSWLTYGSSIELEASRAIVRAALDAGCILFDTADVYARGGAEKVMAASLEGVPRKDYVLATKAFGRMSPNPNDAGLSRKHLRESCDASLQRLGTDYIDLYQCHRFDGETPLIEVVDAMSDLIRQGKILYWGVSEWTSQQMAAAVEIADDRHGYRPISNQPQYNLLEQRIEQDVMPRCKELGIKQLVFSPLAQGILTGKYSDGVVPQGSRAADPERCEFIKKRMSPQNLDQASRLARLAADLGMTPAQLALAWCLRHSNVASAICGATSPEQVMENMAAADITIPEEGLQAVTAILHDEFMA